MPSLTPDILEDEQALGVVLDEVLRDDPEVRALQVVVLERQEALRAAADPGTWEFFLALDAITGDRAAVAQEVLVRWAFSEGRRFGG